MLAIGSIVEALQALVTYGPALAAMGADVVDLFDKGKALVSSDTASTPEERAAAMAEIAGLEAQRDARLEELRTQAPNS